MMRRLAPLFGASLIAATACGVGLGRAPSGAGLAAGHLDLEGARIPRVAPFTPFTRVFRSRVKTDDSDLSGGLSANGDKRARLLREAIARGARLTFPTRTSGAAAAPESQNKDTVPVTGRLAGTNLAGAEVGIPNASVELRGKGGQIVATGVTGPDGAWKIDLDTKYQRIGLSVRYLLANRHWKIGEYDWQGPEFTAGSGMDVGRSVIDGASTNGQAVLIHEIYNRYLVFFAAQGVDLAFWSEAIDTSWPAPGDYYSWGTVNLTEARQWDVNGHEIGHAISDIGLNMRFGGGQHYIDRCYDETLAWSEGVASFLGLAVSVAPDHPDARFEFMVKRRAPLRYENVPGDKDPDHPDAPPVCQGPANEWRAGAAMWDLYDTHDDGLEAVSVPFGTMWTAMRKGNGKPPISSVRHAYKYIRENADPETAARFPAAAKQNTIDL